MARKIHLRLTGKAENFFKEMEALGMTEADIVSKALGILEIVWATKRVALTKIVTNTVVVPDNGNIEYFFDVTSPIVKQNRQEAEVNEKPPNKPKGGSWDLTIEEEKV